jgi:hypothetical protein
MVGSVRMRRTIDASSPPSSPVLNNAGVWLPFGTTSLQLVDANTIQGAPNQEQFYQFVQPYTITIGHVTFAIGTGLAGSLFGVALYSGDGTQKLTAADGVSTATAGNKRPALSSVITLIADATYWIGWTGTDNVTVTILNFLESTFQASIRNQSVTRSGRSTTATAGGVTLATVNNVIAGVQLRIPEFYFDL